MRAVQLFRGLHIVNDKINDFDIATIKNVVTKNE